MSRPIPSLGDACLDPNEMDNWGVQEAAWFSYWWLNADRTKREVPRPSTPASMLLQTCGDAACVHPNHLRILDPRSN